VLSTLAEVRCEAWHPVNPISKVPEAEPVDPANQHDPPDQKLAFDRNTRHNQ
jgi:hypothetical protein